MKTDKPEILIVDDDENVLYAIQQVFAKDGYRSIVARDGEEALEKLNARAPSVVFMDITMPKLDGLAALEQLRQRHHTIPVVIVTGLGTMQRAIRAMQLGAFEYITKPLDVERIRDVTRRALAAVASTSVPANAEAPGTDAQHRHDIVGASAPMQEVYKLIGSVSTTPNHTSVMITGESGTGKELVARAIHAHSTHAAEPFIAINCTAFPETLLESELFGHEKGAFTGATERKRGKFEIAGMGSIFLDEIGNLPMALQQKLLRVLQEREFERLGGNDLIRVNARFISATNVDISGKVRDGTFREDLFYRLNVVTIHLPALHERPNDIPLLAQHFLRKYAGQFNKPINGFSEEALDLLGTYAYPGNVRELENLVERAVMLARGRVILPQMLGEMAGGNPAEEVRLPISSPVFSEARDRLLEKFEKQFLEEQLLKYSGNVTSAARASKMSRQNFQRLMQKHGLAGRQFRQ
jgi:two-component system, NtrC family, response regulator AtoC